MEGGKACRRVQAVEGRFALGEGNAEVAGMGQGGSEGYGLEAESGAVLAKTLVAALVVYLASLPEYPFQLCPKKLVC